MGLYAKSFLFRLSVMILLIAPLSTLIPALIDVQPCGALWTGSTIHIRANGSIYPPNAPVTTVDNITYTLTDDISVSDYGIIIERDNIILDGAGHTIEGNYPSVFAYGIRISGRSNVTVTNVVIKRFYGGINVVWSSNISVSGSSVSVCYSGIYVYSSSGNTITDNVLLGNEFGIALLQSSNNSIVGNNVTGNSNTGIYLGDSSNNNIIARNVVTESISGIFLFRSSDNRVAENNVTNNQGGIMVSGDSLGESVNNSIVENNVISNADKGIALLASSSNSSVIKNIIAYNALGISLEFAQKNSIYHNSFVNNSELQAYIYNSTLNVWDDGYPSGGNYWSDYVGADLYSGPHQNITGSDGIGDTPYAINAENRDRYPLMKPYIEDKTPPLIIEVRRQPEGDVEPNRPVKILVNATDDLSGIKSVILSYCIGDSPSWTDIPMNFNSTSGFYEGIIQVEQENVIVKYKVTAYDNAENYIVEDNAGQYYTYTVIPEHPSTTILLTLIALTTATTILRKRTKKL